MYLLRYLFLLLPIIIIVLIVMGVSSMVRRRRVVYEGGGKQILAHSPDDKISQLFFVLSLLFLGITFLAINRSFGSYFEWQTIAFAVSAVGMALAYLRRVVYSLVISLLGFLAWWITQSLLWINAHSDMRGFAVVSGVVLIFLLYYTLGRLHEKGRFTERAPFVYVALGLLGTLFILFLLSLKLGLYLMESSLQGSTVLASWQIVLVLAVLAVAFFGALVRAVVMRAMGFVEAAFAGAVGALLTVVAFLPKQAFFDNAGGGYFSLNDPLSTYGILWALIYNVVIFAALLGVIFLGYHRKESWYINIGSFFLFALIIVKYFDYFFTFLDKSVFFIGAGIIFFVLGWFMERGRRTMISSVRAERQQITLPT